MYLKHQWFRYDFGGPLTKLTNFGCTFNHVCGVYDQTVSFTKLGFTVSCFRKNSKY